MVATTEAEQGKKQATTAVVGREMTGEEQEVKRGRQKWVEIGYHRLQIRHIDISTCKMICDEWIKEDIGFKKLLIPQREMTGQIRL